MSDLSMPPSISPTLDARARLDGARNDARCAQVENAAADDAYAANPTSEAWNRVLAARQLVDQTSLVLRGVEKLAAEQTRTEERAAFEDALRRANEPAFWAAMEPTVLRVVELAGELRDLMIATSLECDAYQSAVREVRTQARRLKQDEPRLAEITMDNVRSVIIKRLGVALKGSYKPHVIGRLHRYLEEWEG